MAEVRVNQFDIQTQIDVLLFFKLFLCKDRKRVLRVALHY